MSAPPTRMPRKLPAKYGDQIKYYEFVEFLDNDVEKWRFNRGLQTRFLWITKDNVSIDSEGVPCQAPHVKFYLENKELFQDPSTIVKPARQPSPSPRSPRHSEADPFTQLGWGDDTDEQAAPKPTGRRRGSTKKKARAAEDDATEDEEQQQLFNSRRVTYKFSEADRKKLENAKDLVVKGELNQRLAAVRLQEEGFKIMDAGGEGDCMYLAIMAAAEAGGFSLLKEHGGPLKELTVREFRNVCYDALLNKGEMKNTLFFSDDNLLTKEATRKELATIIRKMGVWTADIVNGLYDAGDVMMGVITQLIKCVIYMVSGGCVKTSLPSNFSNITYARGTILLFHTSSQSHWQWIHFPPHQTFEQAMGTFKRVMNYEPIETVFPSERNAMEAASTDFASKWMNQFTFFTDRRLLDRNLKQDCSMRFHYELKAISERYFRQQPDTSPYLDGHILKFMNTYELFREGMLDWINRAEKHANDVVQRQKYHDGTVMPRGKVIELMHTYLVYTNETRKFVEVMKYPAPDMSFIKRTPSDFDREFKPYELEDIFRRVLDQGSISFGPDHNIEERRPFVLFSMQESMLSMFKSDKDYSLLSYPIAASWSIEGAWREWIIRNPSSDPEIALEHLVVLYVHPNVRAFPMQLFCKRSASDLSEWMQHLIVLHPLLIVQKKKTSPFNKKGERIFINSKPIKVTPIMIASDAEDFVDFWFDDRI